jgi:hypothetical protein
VTDRATTPEFLKLAAARCKNSSTRPHKVKRRSNRGSPDRDDDAHALTTGSPELTDYRPREDRMTPPANNSDQTDGALVSAADMTAALTAGTFVFEHGATQVFHASGHTTYVDQHGTTQGEWSAIGDGEFSSFWPPNYRATYTVRWIVDGTRTTGLTFTETTGGQRFEGRYQ